MSKPRHGLSVPVFSTALLLLCSPTLYASFIESTSGVAVVNDATASYYNPAALTLLKNKQVVALGSKAIFHSKFNGSFTQVPTGLVLTGTASNNVNYYLPSLYFGLPISSSFSAGLAIVSNFFNNNVEDTSLLRYVQSSNETQDVDIVPAIGFKVNDHFSIGANVNFSHAKFDMEPIVGFPSLNIPDSQSHNTSTGNGMGGDIGLLFTPNKTLRIGFNYRSAVTYRLSGTSILNGTSQLISHQYKFTFWTPARFVLSTSQLISEKMGVIATVQYIKWNIFKNLNIQGIAAQVGPLAAIVNSTVPYHLHNGWVFTLGSQYHINPKWIIRAAATYLESPQNGNYQLAVGDSVVLGASLSYALSKHLIIDGSYAHGFMQDKKINIINNRNIIIGTNHAARDSASLKLTLNI